MGNIKKRVGSVYIRVGGNTQETATLVQSLPNGEIMYKDNADTNNPVGNIKLQTDTLIDHFQWLRRKHHQLNSLRI